MTPSYRYETWRSLRPSAFAKPRELQEAWTPLPRPVEEEQTMQSPSQKARAILSRRR